MSNFEFAFSLFGLLLGLSVAEVMAGFARVLRARNAIRLGWLTPLVGVLLMVDLVTFWSNAWMMRDAIPPTFEALLFGTVIAAIYYLSASLVFPDPVTDWPDLDAYIMHHKGQVMAGVIVANLLVTVARVLLFGNIFRTWVSIEIPVLFTGLGLGLALTKSKTASLVIVCILLSLYAIFRLL